jgi:hypothetical protein
MNLFFLDRDLDTLARYHIDRHVGKMQLEAVQLMSTCLWVDKYLGFVPRALTPDEWAVIKEAKAQEPTIEERTFTRYLPCHHNHPSAIWMRSSIEHYEWAFCYVQALNDECLYRGYKSHASCAEAQRMPEPKLLASMGWRDPDQAMPPELKTDDVLADYRLFYMLDKAAIPATWRGRDKPEWWDENIAMYDRRYTELSPAERKATGYLK